MHIAVVEPILKVLLLRETNVISISYTRRFIATWSAINSSKHIHLFLVFYSQSITWGLNNIQRNLIDRIWTKDTRMTQSKLNHWATRCQWDGERPKWLREVPATFFKNHFESKKLCFVSNFAKIHDNLTTLTVESDRIDETRSCL